MESQLVKRIKALLWSTGAMAMAYWISLLSEALAGLNLPEWVVVILGLVFAQITKYLNNLTTKE